MKKFFKWAGISIASLIVLLVLVIFFIVSNVHSRLTATMKVVPEKIILPTDSASLELGRHRALLCTECHGIDFGGTEFFKDPSLGVINAPNLTRGEGGIGIKYKDEDWVRSIRHGVNPLGRPLLVMPAKHFQFLSETELAAVIAYVKQVQPVKRKFTQYNVTTLAKLLMGLGAFGDVLNAEGIDHKKKFPASVALGNTIEFGSHMVRISGCRTCHGENLNGAKDPNPDAPPSPNLTPGGNIGKWSEEQFINTLRTGQTPEGKKFNNKFMPWVTLSQLTDTELKAIYTYLKSRKKMESGI